ncbi:MAG TPA: cation diffusion facilitator family transporter [Bacteroidales bacterium]|nr:cation diffusion facilitator family transporter [Bacteroidales bacterium]
MDRSKAGYIEGLVSIIINFILFIIKMWAGIVSNSIAIIADAWHTMSDSISSVVVILGVKLSNKKPDKKHPFGHGRWEQIAAIFIGVILAIIAYDFLKESIINFKGKKAANYGIIAIIVTLISIIIKEALAQYAFYIGRKTNNLSVKADGWHHRSDALSSIVVLIGILFGQKYWWMDSLLGTIVSIMLFYAAYGVIKEAINKILGEKPTPELVAKVENIINTLHPNDLYPHHYHIHNYITHQELTFHIKLDNNVNINTGHKIATDIENKIYEELNITSTVHIEPKDFYHEYD